MDRLIDALISGELNTTSLLLLFIICILTKRFVPWWVHEEALNKLQEYEESAPVLVDEIGTLIDILNDPDVAQVLRDRLPEGHARRMKSHSTELRRVVRRQHRRVDHKRKGRT